MSEEDISSEVTYINGQKVYNESFIEPLVPPLPKSPIISSIEQTGFLTAQIAMAHSSSKALAEQNAFIVQELASTQISNRQLAEQQAGILLLLAEQTISPVNDDESEETETPSEPPDEESPIEESNEENIPEEGDGE